MSAKNSILVFVFAVLAFVLACQAAPIDHILAHYPSIHVSSHQQQQLQEPDQHIGAQHSEPSPSSPQDERSSQPYGSRSSSSSESEESARAHAWSLLHQHQLNLRRQKQQKQSVHIQPIVVSQQDSQQIAWSDRTLEGHAVVDDDDEDAGNELMDTEADGLLRPDADDELEGTIEGQILEVEEGEEDVFFEEDDPFALEPESIKPATVVASNRRYHSRTYGFVAEDEAEARLWKGVKVPLQVTAASVERRYRRR
ncbi:hypothetical protein EMPS_02801 [Entomortierella parvispora]|uniref:Uncharacterized protein n=1 Tax=Entomortierella parvispora TaxID=205924 RepID=A0A9P3H5K0_9FUNG|nr:hypothetical protein EMPS_02801 [Entomortierella parvispora]